MKKNVILIFLFAFNNERKIGSKNSRTYKKKYTHTHNRSNHIHVCIICIYYRTKNLKKHIHLSFIYIIHTMWCGIIIRTNRKCLVLKQCWIFFFFDVTTATTVAVAVAVAATDTFDIYRIENR